MTTREKADFIEMLLAVAVAAMLGGLLAVLVLAFDQELQLGIMLFVVSAVTVLAVLTVGSLSTSPQPRATQPPPRPDRQTRPDPTWYGTGVDTNFPSPLPPASVPPPRFHPPAAQPPVRETREPDVVVPLLSPSPGPSARRIVQCPECGDFKVRLIAQAGDQFDFACRFDHPWTWVRGTPWPTTVVRPANAVRPSP